jgi:2-dehydro-3-deoxygluconokinase
MSNAALRIAAIGECMIELSDLGDGRFSLGFGGDSLNTAVYLARLGCAVDYITALGDDPYSEAMLEFWRCEGIGTAHVRRLAGRLPGLYTIRTDAKGERTFHYWRSASAAREMFRGEDGERLAAVFGYDVLFLTGVSLSILDQASRERLFAALSAAHAEGALTAFDSNYRPRAWPDAASARATFERAARLVDIALPSLDDEAALFGEAKAEDVAARYAAWGVREVAVKDGPRACHLRHAGGSVEVPADRVDTVVDTTAAGDAFDAGYLSARLGGQAPDVAARHGHRLATAVIGHRGAVIPAAAMPSLDDEARPRR